MYMLAQKRKEKKKEEKSWVSLFSGLLVPWTGLSDLGPCPSCHVTMVPREPMLPRNQERNKRRQKTPCIIPTPYADTTEKGREQKVTKKHNQQREPLLSSGRKLRSYVAYCRFGSVSRKNAVRQPLHATRENRDGRVPCPSTLRRHVAQALGQTQRRVARGRARHRERERDECGNSISTIVYLYLSAPASSKRLELVVLLRPEQSARLLFYLYGNGCLRALLSNGSFLGCHVLTAISADDGLAQLGAS